MAKQTSRLGKGLNALMQEAEVSEPAVKKTNVKTKLPKGIDADENGTLWVNPNLLKPNPWQPRTFFDEEKLAELTVQKGQ